MNEVRGDVAHWLSHSVVTYRANGSRLFYSRRLWKTRVGKEIQQLSWRSTDSTEYSRASYTKMKQCMVSSPDQTRPKKIAQGGGCTRQRAEDVPRFVIHSCSRKASQKFKTDIYKFWNWEFASSACVDLARCFINFIVGQYFEVN